MKFLILDYEGHSNMTWDGQGKPHLVDVIFVIREHISFFKITVLFLSFKVQKFIRGRILETKIAGKIAASLIRCLIKARPNKGLPAFLPAAMDIVDNLLTDEMNEKLIDEELKFNLLIMSEVS